MDDVEDLEVDAGVIGEELDPAGVAPDGSRGLIPNMPTIGLVGLLLSDFDIRASESSRREQHRATNLKLPTEKIHSALQRCLNHARTRIVFGLFASRKMQRVTQATLHAVLDKAKL